VFLICSIKIQICNRLPRSMMGRVGCNRVLIILPYLHERRQQWWLQQHRQQEQRQHNQPAALQICRADKVKIRCWLLGYRYSRYSQGWWSSTSGCVLKIVTQLYPSTAKITFWPLLVGAFIATTTATAAAQDIHTVVHTQTNNADGPSRSTALHWLRFASAAMQKIVLLPVAAVAGVYQLMSAMMSLEACSDSRSPPM
jgi:hypothetical protein